MQFYSYPILFHSLLFRYVLVESIHFHTTFYMFDKLLLCACYHKEVSDTFLSVIAISHEILSLRPFSLWNDHKDIIKKYIYSYKKYRKAQATTTLTTHLFIYYFFHFFPPLCCRVFLCRRQRNNNNNNTTGPGDSCRRWWHLRGCGRVSRKHS